MTDDKIALRELLEKSSDASLLREMIGFAAQRLMELEIEALCGAGHGERSAEPHQPAQRLPRPRLGDPRRHRRAAHPEAAQGQLLPGLPRAAPDGREGADRGDPGSLRPGHLDPLGRRSGQGDGHGPAISKSQVSRLCAEIDERVQTFLHRPIEGDWPYLWLDATYVKVRQDGRIVSVAVIVAVGVNTDGRREVLGMTIGASEAEPFWTEFLRRLTRRGLRGVKLVDLRRPRGPEGRDRQGAQRHLAALPRALHAQRPGACRQDAAARRLRLDRHRLRPGRCRGRPQAVAPGRRSAAPAGAEARRPDGRRRGRRAGLHELPRSSTAPRSTAPTRSNGSTARSSGAPTSSASSPTRLPSSASSAPCCSSRTTNGPCSAPAT